METTLATRPDELSASSAAPHGKSAASWGAIIAGAFVAVSTSLILLAVGAGLGFASVSPWQGQGVSATTFTVTTAIWLIVTQWVSAALGGYIAGRLRTRWIGTHTHEVFFRDTAQGLITWSLATVVVAGLVASSASSAFRAATDVVSSGAQGAMSALGSPSTTYGMDQLFRSTDVDATTADYRTETAHILANAISSGNLPPADRTYLGNVVAKKTGVSAEEGQHRVDDFVRLVMDAETKAKAAADVARSAAAQASLYTALSMLIGAFIASVSAALGGRLRDQHV